MSAQRLLDRVQSLAAVEGVDAAAFTDELRAELPATTTLADLETRDGTLSAALAAIDAFAARAMRIRMEHALASDPSIAAPTQRVFAQTVTQYEGRLGILEQRALDVATRGGASDARASASNVVECARATLGLRDELRAAVLALVRELAIPAVAHADACARDRNRGEPERKKWSAARRELDVLVIDPARITTPWAGRIASWPEQLDEPAAEPPMSIADLIEID
jgi:hypothetical protein